VLDQRSNDLELVDRPDSKSEDVARSLWFCTVANRYFGGTRVVRKFLQAEFARVPVDRPLRVLDIGAGSCDIPLALSRWARGRGRDIQFVCLERHPHAAHLAREAVAAARDPRVRVLEEDVLAHQPEHTYDYAIGSLFFHHMTDEDVLTILGRLRGVVRRAVLVNDLRRCGVCYRLGSAVSRLFSPVARHDLLLSIRRGFRPWELRRLLRRMKGATVSVTGCWFCRLAAVVRFD